MAKRTTQRPMPVLAVVRNLDPRICGCCSYAHGTRVLEADSAVQAADKKFNAAVKMHREAQNKLSNISLDLQRVERRVGHAKRDLADYMEQRKLNEAAKADVDVSKYEKIEHERRKVASTVRAVLDKIAAGETKVTW